MQLSTQPSQLGGAQTSRTVMELRDLIVSGRLPPQSRIAESLLTELLGVSRTPVRAALQRMEEEGLVEPIPSGGYSVRRFSSRDIADAIEIRGALEGIAARMAAERGVAPEVLERLEAVADEIDKVLAVAEFGSPELVRYTDLNASFHATVVAAAGSDILQQDIARASARPFAGASSLVQMITDIQHAKHVLMIAQDQHRSIIAALREREGARVEALVREHARISKRTLYKALAASGVSDAGRGNDAVGRVNNAVPTILRSV